MTPRRQASGLGPPIDRGYAWVVAFGAFFNLFIILGVAKSLGIIFVALREHYGRSATSTAVLYPLLAASSLMMGPLITALTEKFTIRSVCMAGALLCCLGTTVGYFGATLEAVILPYGIIAGLGGGMVLNPGPLIVSRYFDKRKSAAMGLVFAGTGLGGMVGPFVVAALMEHYGLHASILLIGAINLHTLVGSALFRPLASWPQAPKTSSKALLQAEAETKEDLGEVYKSALSLSNLDLPATADVGKGRTLGGVRGLLYRQTEDGEVVPILDFCVLADPRFLLFGLGCLAGMAGFYWNMLTPAYCEEELGMSAGETAWLLSAMGAGDLSGRVLVGLTGDRCLAKARPLAVGLALLLMAAATALCPFFPAFWAQVAVLVVGTMGFGAFVALGPVALGDLVPKDSLASAWGFLLFLEGLGHIITPLAIGALKDHYGTYFPGYFLVSGACLLGGILVCAAAMMHKLR